MKKITILGSTGHVGQKTLDIIENYPEFFQVFALVGREDVMTMASQVLKFSPKLAVLSDPDAALALQRQLAPRKLGTQVLSGERDICAVAQDRTADIVVSAIMGTAGLRPTLAAIQAGRCILLANKEALVTSGALMMRAMERFGASILPIDSEHNAIFQCLPAALQQSIGTMSLSAAGISAIILTGSGGPLREYPLADLKAVTPLIACRHPHWAMGNKLSVDSATMVNKGLEYIEAKWLFNAAETELDVVVHPQSVVHGMVRFFDGGLLAALSVPDMRYPLMHALGYPHRLPEPRGPMAWSALSGLTFEPVDRKRYPGFGLALEASGAGQGPTTVFNAANEVAVGAFLAGRLGFMQMIEVLESVLAASSWTTVLDLEAVLSCDAWARRCAEQVIGRLGGLRIGKPG